MEDVTASRWLSREASLGLIAAVLDGTYAPTPDDYDQYMRDVDKDALESRHNKRRAEYPLDRIVGVLPREIDELFRYAPELEPLTIVPETPAALARELITLGNAVALSYEIGFDDVDWGYDEAMSSAEVSAERLRRINQFEEHVAESRDRLNRLVLRLRQCRPQYRRRVVDELAAWATLGVTRQSEGGVVTVPDIPEGSVGNTEKPHYDLEARILTFRGKQLKRYGRNPASTQTKVLEAFQTAGWPMRISAAPAIRVDQIRATNTGLNLSLGGKNAEISFHGDGTGRGIVWQVRQPHS